jgi:hypothetical protein
MEIIITNGSYSGEEYSESSRISINIKDPTTTRIKEILVMAKKEPQPPYMERLKEYFYLMRPDSKKKLEESKILGEYNIRKNKYYV